MNISSFTMVFYTESLKQDVENKLYTTKSNSIKIWIH